MGAVGIRISVAASDREQAFAACRFIIDQIKARVPVEKRETYLDGSSGWAPENCEQA